MGSIDLGNTPINKTYLGSTEIKSVYLGSTLIWQSSGSSTPTTEYSYQCSVSFINNASSNQSYVNLEGTVIIEDSSGNVVYQEGLEIPEINNANGTSFTFESENLYTSLIVKYVYNTTYLVSGVSMNLTKSNNNVYVGYATAIPFS